MNLTPENTAIVLDSTSDFPEAGDRFPNMRIVPLYVNFGAESFQDHVDIGSHDFYERLKAAPDAADDLAADAAGLPRRLRGARRLRADLRAPALGRSCRAPSSLQCWPPARSTGTGSGVVDTETASLAVGLLALAIERRLARGTTDEEVDGLIERFKRENGVVFTVGTLEYLQKGGRIGRAQALAGTLLNVKPIMSVDDGVIHPIGKVRGRQKALAEFARVFTAATEDRPGLRIAIAHADAPGVGRGAHRPASRRRGPRPRSSSSRTSAPSSAPTPAPARSASSGSRTSRRPRSAALAWAGAGPILGPGARRTHRDPAAGRLRRPGPAGTLAPSAQRSPSRGARGRRRDAAACRRRGAGPPGEARPAHRRRPARSSATTLRAADRGADDPRSVRRGRGRDRGHRARDDLAPGPRQAPNPDGPRRRRHGRDQGDLVQPAVARGAADVPARACGCVASRTATASRSRATTSAR